ANEIAGPTGLAAFGPAGENLLARSGILRSVVNFPDRCYLRRREAIVSIPAFAQERSRVELTAARIANQSIFDAVERIARRHDRFGEHGQLRRWQRTCGIFVQRLPRPKKPGDQMNSVVARITRDNSVVIVGIPLRFRQGLMAARGAAGEVSILRE